MHPLGQRHVRGRQQEVLVGCHVLAHAVGHGLREAVRVVLRAVAVPGRHAPGHPCAHLHRHRDLRIGRAVEGQQLAVQLHAEVGQAGRALEDALRDGARVEPGRLPRRARLRVTRRVRAGVERLAHDLPYGQVVGVRVQAVLRMRYDNLRSQLADERHNLPDRLLARQILDPAVRPVQPAQFLDADMRARAFQLAGAHLRQVLAGRAVVAEDRGDLPARCAHQDRVHPGIAVIAERRADADLVVRVGKDGQNGERWL
ncbi:MAG: hypothetical protein BWY52_02632 [Chloroflexi bacterium ADurb.Bin325]|nr:MAG: hypothetical protein BWY52_02632 [Chloroflexi bacterium ADurb.Bin325]